MFSICTLYGVIAMATVSIEAVRVWPSPDGTRLVFDLNNRLDYHLFTLHNPERVVIDFKQAALNTALHTVPLSKTQIKKIRYAKQPGNTLRVVLDLKTSMSTKSFTLKPNEQYGNRLVVDLSAKTAVRKPKIELSTESLATEKPAFVIAIDAGHGGEDPGASGRYTKEKDVVLAIAKRLATEMKHARRVKPYLIRSGDYYIGLRQRMQKARDAQADLFVSIHADAFKNHLARGASVYILSPHGATSEAARWLAETENRADLIGGISLDDKDDLLASVLLDLSQTASSEASFSVAQSVLGHVGKISKLHSSRVQKAGFAVLKAPDIPSILVETAFISNPKGEKNLRSAWFQRRMAQSILTGIQEYYKDKPLPKMRARVEHRKHQYTVSRGDTLSELSKRFGITIKEIKRANNMHNDNLHIGQKLKVPA